MRIDDGTGHDRHCAVASLRAAPAAPPSSASAETGCPRFRSKLPAELSATERSCNLLLLNRAAAPAAPAIRPVLVHQVAHVGGKLRCGSGDSLAMRNPVERMRELRMFGNILAQVAKRFSGLV